MTNTTELPLNKLTTWSGNVRKTTAAEGLTELCASIEAHGLLQSLVVRKAARGKYAVIAGNRRLRALQHLAENGQLAKDAPVPCRIVAGKDDEATEISLAENVIRTPMHPADQFEAFRDLVDGGATVEEIAARFGMSSVAVKQRLKLGRVSSILLTAYRQGEMTLEQIQAFAVIDDAETQERVWLNLPEWGRDPQDIRSALTAGEVAATDRRVRFVGIDAYEQAGGLTRRDLFSDGDDGCYILDRFLLDRLAVGKLESLADEVKAEGWRWVEIHPEFGYEERSRFKQRHPEPVPLSPEQEAELQALEEEQTKLYDSEEDDEHTAQRLEEVTLRIEALEDREAFFTPETLAIGGAVLTIDRDGSCTVHRGLIRPEDMPKNSAKTKANGATTAKPGELPASLTEDLTRCRSAALSASLMARPETALAATVHALALDVFYHVYARSCLRLSLSDTRLPESGPASTAIESCRTSWTEQLPSADSDLWAWCLEQSTETLLSLLAFCTALSIDAVQSKGDNPAGARLSHSRDLAAALSLDMSAWYEATAVGFFGRLTKGAIVSALEEVKAAPAAPSWAGMKKADLASLAEREAKGSGWLPGPLRAA